MSKNELNNSTDYVKIKLDRLVENLSTEYLFFKDSLNGKIHFQLLYNQVKDILDYYPNKLYQVFLVFTENDELICKDGKSNVLINDFKELLYKEFKMDIFIDSSESAPKEIIKLMYNEPYNKLCLDNFPNYKGVQFFFFS
jgi:hypothetical protein